MDRSAKIAVPAGCTEYLVKEVESLRQKNAILSAENRVMNSFFAMVDRLGPKKDPGFEQDMLWQAKKDIAEATKLEIEKSMAAMAPKGE